MAEEDISFILNLSFPSDEEEQTGDHVDDQLYPVTMLKIANSVSCA